MKRGKAKYILGKKSLKNITLRLLMNTLTHRKGELGPLIYSGTFDDNEAAASFVQINIIKFNQLANKLIRQHMVRGAAFMNLFSIVIFFLFTGLLWNHITSGSFTMWSTII